jgi:hypothetical protein
MMEKEIAAIFDDFNGGTSTIVYVDGSKEISGPDGTMFVPAPNRSDGTPRGTAL